jgi:uncharacterized protein involved in exopolysaccharide biosynthesis
MQYQEALAIEAANFGNVNIWLLSEAVAPFYADNKNIMLFGGASVILGAAAGVFAVLMANYWRSEGDADKPNKPDKLDKPDKKGKGTVQV